VATPPGPAGFTPHGRGAWSVVSAVGVLF
jgi:hypothetical protein